MRSRSDPIKAQKLTINYENVHTSTYKSYSVTDCSDYSDDIYDPAIILSDIYWV